MAVVLQMKRIAHDVADFGFTVILVIGVSLAALLVLGIQLICLPFVFVSKQIGKLQP